ncbi:MAG: hypothetical protein ACRDQA_05355 [Nocardioidaceae bacterium]
MNNRDKAVKKATERQNMLRQRLKDMDTTTRRETINSLMSSALASVNMSGDYTDSREGMATIFAMLSNTLAMAGFANALDLDPAEERHSVEPSEFTQECDSLVTDTVLDLMSPEDRAEAESAYAEVHAESERTGESEHDILRRKYKETAQAPSEDTTPPTGLYL